MTFRTDRVEIPLVNYGRGRTMPIDLIVDHVTEGNAASVRSWFGTARPENPTSAHWMIETTGNRVQFVEETDRAYHAGRVDHPTAALVLERPGVNPNAYSVGIEHEGDGRHPLTPAQLESSVELHREIAARYGFPLDRRHVVGHHEIYRPKSCPGAIDVGALVAIAAAGGPVVAPVLERPDPPPLVWSNYLRDWLVVLDVRSDTDWTFVRLGDIRNTSGPRGQSRESLAGMLAATEAGR